MACEHIRKLYKYIKENNIQLSSYDLIRFVCKKCQIKDVCPSNLVEDIPKRI